VENRKFLLLVISAVVVVSGCSQLPGSSSSENDEPRQVSGKGLEVMDFSVTDKTVSPGQEIEANLRLQNYHRNEIDIGNVSLYNLGPNLERSDKNCSPDEIDPAQEGIYPVMECSWKIEVAEDVGGFDQRKEEISVNIPYDSTIENYQPMTVEFRPLDQINRTDKKAMSFSNGEVSVEAEVESPVALNQDKLVDFKVSKAGNGRIDGAYEFDYSPSSVFVQDSDARSPCPSSDEPVIENKVSFSCALHVEGSEIVERNLFFTVSYKYIQAPSIDITIVK